MATCSHEGCEAVTEKDCGHCEAHCKHESEEKTEEKPAEEAQSGGSSD